MGGGNSGFLKLLRHFPNIFGSGGHPSQLEQLTAYLKGRLEREHSPETQLLFSRRWATFPRSAVLSERYEYDVHHKVLGKTAPVTLTLDVKNGIPREFTLLDGSSSWPLWGYTFSQDPLQYVFPIDDPSNALSSTGSDDDDYDDEKLLNFLFPLIIERSVFHQFSSRVKPYMRFDYENV